MFRALVWKELRVAWPVALPFLLMQIWLTASLATDPEDPLLRTFDLIRRGGWFTLPMLMDDYVVPLHLIAIGMGVLLGFSMTLPESISGTAGSLVHLARSRTRIVLSKMVAAGILYGAAVVAPLAIGVAIMMGPRIDHCPYDASDFSHSAMILLSGAVAYLGALAAGLRGRIFPWRNGLIMLSLLGVMALGIGVALERQDLVWMGAVAGLAALASFSGFAVREF